VHSGAFPPPVTKCPLCAKATPGIINMVANTASRTRTRLILPPSCHMSWHLDWSRQSSGPAADYLREVRRKYHPLRPRCCDPPSADTATRQPTKTERVGLAGSSQEPVPVVIDQTTPISVTSAWRSGAADRAAAQRICPSGPSPFPPQASLALGGYAVYRGTPGYWTCSGPNKTP
jgi:hypothetical protein